MQVRLFQQEMRSKQTITEYDSFSRKEAIF